MAVGQFASAAPVPGLQSQYISDGPASTIKPFSGLPLVHPTHWERGGLLFMYVSLEMLTKKILWHLTQPRSDRLAVSRRHSSGSG